MFSRMYLEITTCCNLSCSFCPGTKRPAAFLSPEDFRTLAAKLRPYGQYLYLHVMGEPLLHPQLPELLGICRALGFRATLTTNGTLLPKKQAALLDAPALRKVSISLHSFEANEAGDFSAYLTGCTDFAHAAKKSGILTDFRLWNLDGAQTKGLHDRNAEILAQLHAAFPGVWQKNTWGWRLEDGVFVSFGERFDWPDEQAAERGSQRPPERQQRLVRRARAVKQIACQQDKITVVRVGRLGKLGQKLALLLPPRSSLFGAEGGKRRVQMQIGGMQKFNHGAPPFLPPCSGLSSRRW